LGLMPPSEAGRELFMDYVISSAMYLMHVALRVQPNYASFFEIPSGRVTRALQSDHQFF